MARASNYDIDVRASIYARVYIYTRANIIILTGAPIYHYIDVRASIYVLTCAPVYIDVRAHIIILARVSI